MKKAIIILTVALILAIAAIPLTWYFSRCKISDDTIIITDTAPLTPTTWTKPPDTCPQCGDKIDIFGAVKQNVFFVTAQDECKRNSREFAMKTVLAPKKHHSIFAGYAPMYDIDARAFRHTLDVAYLYSIGRVSIGGGIAIEFDGIRIYQAGPRVTVGYQW